MRAVKARLAKKLLQTLRRTQVVRPGDGLLVSIPRHMDMELAEVQVQGLRQAFNVPVAVVLDDVTVQVIEHPLS